MKQNICNKNHIVKTPIYINNRETFNKYVSGELKLPTKCNCGIQLVYENPKYIIFEENGFNRALYYPDPPLNFIRKILL